MEKKGIATVFEFVSYDFKPQEKRVLFHYRQHFRQGSPLEFTETVILPKNTDASRLPKDFLANILAGIHLVLGTSYYKLHAAKKVLHPYQLTKEEAGFWDAVYGDGLGEFYFRNDLDPAQSPKFPFSRSKKPMAYRLSKSGKMLVGLSGGKDSIVAAELLKAHGEKITGFFVETNRATKLVDHVAKTMGVALEKTRRNLDPKVFEKHAYNGHIPISAVYAFLGVFHAALYGYSSVVVANEHSSNFGNAVHRGSLARGRSTAEGEVNHQWSKSLAFEKLFSDYLRYSLTPDINYFSLMRPFYEIRIAKMFVEHKKYFPYFSSCNKNFKLEQEHGHGLWCGSCPKCAFAFVMFSAFLGKEELLAIFNKNLYEDESLLPLFKDILGLGTMKPFDCVGTFEESQAAFAMGAEKFGGAPAVRALLPLITVNKAEIEKLFKVQPDSLVPARLKFLGMESALLVGYGKEGKATEEYLKEYYPGLKIGIADQSISEHYLDLQKDFDMGVKSPGIKQSVVVMPYTTATNIFFSAMREKGNLIIGVTGSKGKSTTAALMHAVLKAAGKRATFVGNIGKPMLGALLRPVKKDEIFVVELSSYQLADLRYSPDVAIVTNLHHEHLDYHGSVEAYHAAKKNIIALQNTGDALVYNSADKVLRTWAKEVGSRAVPMAPVSALLGVELRIKGGHNRENARLVYAAAKRLGINDGVIREALANFKPLPHRLELVGTFRQVTFYDDANAAIPEATVQAIRALRNVDTIFLGGQDRGYDFSELEKTIGKYKIRNAVLFPDTGNRMRLPGVNTLKTSQMEAAVLFAYENTRPGKICLLSCASPSYSLWKNFEEKGNEFQSLVKKYGKTKAKN